MIVAFPDHIPNFVSAFHEQVSLLQVLIVKLASCHTVDIMTFLRSNIHLLARRPHLVCRCI